MTEHQSYPPTADGPADHPTGHRGPDATRDPVTPAGRGAPRGSSAVGQALPEEPAQPPGAAHAGERTEGGGVPTGYGIRAADGLLEPADDAEDEPGADLEMEKRSFVAKEWPVLAFDIALLANPDADPDLREAEWRLVYGHFDPYLRFYFEDVLGYHDVDEIVAAVWRRALRKINSLDAAENAWWWLVRVGRNHHLDERRRDRRRMQNDRTGLDRMTDDAPDDWRDVVLDTITRETTFQDEIDLREFRAAFGDLKDLDQEFAYLLAVEELSHEDVVSRLGLTSVAASRQRWRWIKRKLSQALGVTSPRPAGR